MNLTGSKTNHTYVSSYVSKLNFNKISLFDLSLLLEIDYIVLAKQNQSELIKCFINRILQTKSISNSSSDCIAILELLQFARRRRIRLGTDSKLLMHLAEILPIESLSKAMVYIKLSNYEYEDVIELYKFLTKKYFAIYNIANIDLLNVMNVYMPA